MAGNPRVDGGDLMGRRYAVSEYYLYHGDDVVGYGTAKQLATKFGVKEDTIRYYSAPVTARRRAGGHGYIAVNVGKAGSGEK